MEEFIVSERILGSFDVDFIEPENLLFQAGYLTIRKVENTPKGPVYYLSYPNKEVRVSLNEYLVSHYTQQGGRIERLGHRIREALERGKIEEVEVVLRSLFSGIPFDWYRKNNLSEYEGYYGSVVYSFLQGVGFEVVAEDVTSKGRIDLAIKVGERVYLMEFKVVEREGEVSALEVLKRKGYGEKYRGVAKELYLLGLDFSERNRNIVNFQWERV